MLMANACLFYSKRKTIGEMLLPLMAFGKHCQRIRLTANEEISFNPHLEGQNSNGANPNAAVLRVCETFSFMKKMCKPFAEPQPSRRLLLKNPGLKLNAVSSIKAIDFFQVESLSVRLSSSDHNLHYTMFYPTA